MADLARVIRLPGYVHLKGEPFRSRLLHCDPTQPWTWPQFAEAMGLPLGVSPVKNSEEQWMEGERNTRLYAFAWGLRTQGIEQPEAIRRALLANDRHCIPSLDPAEVECIVANAWTGKRKGYVQLRHDLVDCNEFRALPHIGKVTVLALARRFDGRNNGRVSLTRNEAQTWGLSRDQRKKGLKACVEAHLIEYTQHAMPASTGQPASPDLFRLLWLAG